jgi:CheY-like chemotaxis protein
MLNNQDGMSQSGSQAVALGTILILEDEAMVSIMMEELVRDMGAGDVIMCGDAQQASEIVGSARIDFAILDVHHGQGTSFAVADALDARGIPFIFSSALGTVAVEERHRNRPMLSKPFADEELRTHVLSLLPAMK